MIVECEKSNSIIQHVWKQSLPETKIPVSWDNSTVNGYNYNQDRPGWAGLDFNKAEFLENGEDPYLRVSWDHPEDRAAGIMSGSLFRVRPRKYRRFERAELIDGVWHWVYRHKKSPKRV